MSWRNAVAPKVEKLVRRKVGSQGPRKNLGSHIDASHSRQPLVKGERLVRYEVNAVMLERTGASLLDTACKDVCVSEHPLLSEACVTHNNISDI